MFDISHYIDETSKQLNKCLAVKHNKEKTGIYFTSETYKVAVDENITMLTSRINRLIENEGLMVGNALASHINSFLKPLSSNAHRLDINEQLAFTGATDRDFEFW